jgi:TatD DNase family protein
MYRLVDIHSHLDEIEDLDAALAEAGEKGVIAVIGAGMDMNSDREMLRIADKHRGLAHTALGWHPWQIAEPDIDETLSLIDDNAASAVAIGEVGLDYHKRVRARAEKDLQKRVLKELLAIAARHGKPAVIHSRYAWRDAFELVAASGLSAAVFHWYTGPSSVLRDIIDSGYYLSATPAVEYHEEHRRAIKEVPFDRLLLETDSPVVYGRGRDFEFESRPRDVLRSLGGAAALKGLKEAEMAETTTRNALRLFDLGQPGDSRLKI